MGQTWRVSEGEQCGAADEGRCCCWKAPLSVLSKELGVLPVRATSQPPGVLTHNKMLLLVLGHCWVRLKNASLQGCRLTACTFPTQDRTPSTTRGLQPSCLDTYNLRRSFMCPGDPVS